MNFFIVAELLLFVLEHFLFNIYMVIFWRPSGDGLWSLPGHHDYKHVQKVQILSWSSNKVSAKVSNLSSQSRFYDLKWVKCGRTDVKEWNCEKRLKRNLPSWRRWRKCFRILEVKQKCFHDSYNLRLYYPFIEALQLYRKIQMIQIIDELSFAISV